MAAREEMCGPQLQKLQIDRTLLWAWGANGYGQLGVGYISEKLIPSDKPVPVCETMESDIIKNVGGGGGFSYIVTESGKVLTGGNNNKGQLGHCDVENLTTFMCSEFLSPVKIIKIAAGWDFMLALSDTGCLLSWGSNSFGQLGRTLQDGANWDARPVAVNGLTVERQIDVAAGLRHGLSLSECGKVCAWGHGRRGQLGSESGDNAPVVKAEHPIQVHVPGSEKPVQVLAGMYHSGLLTDAGSVLIWGCNKYGQCGKKPDISRIVLVPCKVEFPPQLDLNKVVAVASGWTHIIARTESGALYSWGRADLCQLGRECDKAYDHIPKLVTGLPPVKGHACGSEHTLAVTESGDVYSWGWNEHSICGTEDEEDLLLPYQIPQFVGKHVTSVGCGTGHSFCVVRNTVCPDNS